MPTDQPTVCAILLTRDRPELAKKAIECFRRQTYENKALLIYDSSNEPACAFGCAPDVYHIQGEQKVIGAMRNKANAFRGGYALHGHSDIIIHWDDDDYSHPNRITEQVALLQASGADVVGYNEMLFWDTRYRDNPCDYCEGGDCCLEEAWLYSYSIPKPTLGTSLCYWRKTWEQRPFNPSLPNNSQSTGEDTDFIRDRKVAAVSSVYTSLGPNRGYDREPRMIARIHGANSTKYNLDEHRGDTWKRVQQWDDRVREILK